MLAHGSSYTVKSVRVQWLGQPCFTGSFSIHPAFNPTTPAQFALSGSHGVTLSVCSLGTLLQGARDGNRTLEGQILDLYSSAQM